MVRVNMYALNVVDQMSASIIDKSSPVKIVKDLDHLVVVVMIE